MKITVEYNSYNTGIEEAIIESGTDEKFILSIVEDIENPSNPKSLEIRTEDVTGAGITLGMSLEEMKQFNLLTAQLMRQLAQ